MVEKMNTGWRFERRAVLNKTWSPRMKGKNTLRSDCMYTFHMVINIYQLSDLTGANATPMPTTPFGTSHMQFVGPTFHVQSVGRIPIPHHHRQDKDQAPLKDVCLDRVKEDKKRMAASQSDAVATTSEAWIGFQKKSFWNCFGTLLGSWVNQSEKIIGNLIGIDFYHHRGWFVGWLTPTPGFAVQGGVHEALRFRSSKNGQTSEFDYRLDQTLCQGWDCQKVPLLNMYVVGWTAGRVFLFFV